MGDSLEARVQQLEYERRIMQIDMIELKRKQEAMVEEVGQLRKHVLRALIMSGDTDEAYKMMAKAEAQQAQFGYEKSVYATEVTTSSDKVENLGKIAKGMDELTKQVEELKSCMTKVESSGAIQSQNNFVQLDVPPFYPPAYHPPNSGQWKNPYNFHQPRPYHQPNFRPITSFRPPIHGSKSQPKSQLMSQPQSPKREHVELTDLIPIPCTYTELFPQLLQRGLVAFLPYANPMKKPTSWYNANAYCAYHSGTQGHSIEDCPKLKQEVQRLIRMGELVFDADGNPSFS